MSNASFPHFNVDTVDWTPIPQYGGAEAILYKSEDGTRLAGSFRESGTHTMVMAYDEFLYLVGGTVKLTIEGEATVELGRGDCCYLRQGQKVTWEMSPDFHDVTVLVSDTPIQY